MLVKSYSFVVVGSGVAGLMSAIQAAKYGKVALLSKDELTVCSSFWAQGGVAACMSAAITSAEEQAQALQQHVADTIQAGDGLCNDNVVRYFVEKAPAIIAKLVKYGATFDRDLTGFFALGKEGGHQQRIILHAKDYTGKMLHQTLLKQVLQHENIEVIPHSCAIDIDCDASASTQGLYVLSNRQVWYCQSPRVLLATGGCSKVYLYTTNPDSSTGDGLAMAARAGCRIHNMEFMQFHPTCFYNPLAKNARDRAFLISEALRGEGGIIRNEKGEDFITKVDSRGSLASRDIVARAISQELKKSGEKCVYLDITHHSKSFLQQRFPSIYQILSKYHIFPEKNLIPIVPAAHYQCGGVATDVHGKTNIAGLYAIGEISCTGFHGANRLASNSLLESLVMGDTAVAQLLSDIPLTKQVTKQATTKRFPTNNILDQTTIYHNWLEIRQTMWNYAGITRKTNHLQRAATRLANLCAEIEQFYQKFHPTKETIELRNLVTAASLIVTCALKRQTSRGNHYIEEDLRDKSTAKPTTVYWQNN